jgi:ubiquinone/menaquinone biosynthesis C-methylase UbiE
MSGSDLIGRLANLLAKPLLARMPEDKLMPFLAEIAAERANSLPPDKGLKFLFGLDEKLYPVQGWLSVAYDGGVHTKHRHTRYHDFFVNRIHEGERVLDVGCGIGALAIDIAVKSEAFVVGIDLEAKNIAQAKQRFAHPNIDYMVGDATEQALDGPFDVAVLSNVLEHIEKRVEFLRGLIRRATPGRVLLRVPMFERDWRVPLKKELGIEFRLDPTHWTEYTPESFVEELASAGLQIKEQEFRWGEIWAEAVPV